MLAKRTTHSNVIIFSIKVGQIRDLIIANQNLAGKEREDFMIDSECVIAYVGSGLCSTICLATHLKSSVRRSTLLEIIAYLICLIHGSNLTADSGALYVGANYMRWSISSEM